MTECSEMGCTNTATEIIDGPNGKVKLPVCDFHHTPDIGTWVSYNN